MPITDKKILDHNHKIAVGLFNIIKARGAENKKFREANKDLPEKERREKFIKEGRLGIRTSPEMRKRLEEHRLKRHEQIKAKANAAAQNKKSEKKTQAKR